MSKKELKQFLEGDYRIIRSEYESEDKDRIYKPMYERFIDSYIIEQIKQNNFSKFSLTTYSDYFCDNKYEISIVVDRYIETKAFFCSLYDLEDISFELRRDDKFRKFTKFALYLEEIIPPRQ